MAQEVMNGTRRRGRKSCTLQELPRTWISAMLRHVRTTGFLLSSGYIRPSMA